MNFFTWLTTKRKTLATMNVTELRAQEMLLENDRDRLAARMRKLAQDKQEIIDRGAKEKTPEMRRSMAQQFDLMHTEQMMTGRHLNIRTKELLTVARLRMLRETSTRSAAMGEVGGRVAIREQDLATIERLIETDSITAEAYQERLDALLDLGHEADAAASATGLSSAANELLSVWDDLDAGLIEDNQAAFDEAEKRVRERGKAAE